MRCIPALITIIFVISVLLSSCAKPEQALTSTELLDLGEKYLLELNYEQALVQFTKVIEIEPMNPRGYTGAAEVYAALGQHEEVKKILQQGYEATGSAEIEDLLSDATSEQEDSEDEPQTDQATEVADAENQDSGSSNLLQGEYISQAGDLARYKYNLVDGVPRPMGTNDANGEIIMAYMSGRSSVNEEWSEWTVAPHYWAGLRCTDCGEIPADRSMPDWFRNGNSHSWSGEWDKAPRKFYSN